MPPHDCTHISPCYYYTHTNTVFFLKKSTSPKSLCVLANNQLNAFLQFGTKFLNAILSGLLQIN